MLTLRQRIFLTTGIVVGLAIALLLLYLYVFKPRIAEFSAKGEKKTEQVPANVLGGNQLSQPTIPTTGSIKPPADPDGLYAKQVAKNFVERFSTYSNQNNNVQIDDVLLMATNKMAAWIKQQTVKQESVYKGVTAKVISTDLMSINGQGAEVSVGVQLVEETTSTSNTVYKYGTVNLLKVDNDWKVDGLFWEK